MKMDIKQIDERLKRKIGELKEKVEKGREDYQTALNTIKTALENYRTQLRPDAKGYVGNNDSLLALQGHLGDYQPADKILETLLDAIKERLGSISRNQPYSKRTEIAERILDNLHGTFGTSERRVTDTQNRVNCLNNEDYCGDPQHPWFADENGLYNPRRSALYFALTSEDRSLLKERKVNKKKFEELVKTAIVNPPMFMGFGEQVDFERISKWKDKMSSYLG